MKDPKHVLRHCPFLRHRKVTLIIADDQNRPGGKLWGTKYDLQTTTAQFMSVSTSKAISLGPWKNLHAEEQWTTAAWNPRFLEPQRSVCVWSEFTRRLTVVSTEFLMCSKAAEDGRVQGTSYTSITDLSSLDFLTCAWNLLLPSTHLLRSESDVSVSVTKISNIVTKGNKIRSTNNNSSVHVGINL